MNKQAVFYGIGMVAVGFCFVAALCYCAASTPKEKAAVSLGGYTFVENTELKEAVLALDDKFPEWTRKEIAHEQVRLCKVALEANSTDATALRLRAFSLVTIAEIEGVPGEPHPTWLGKAKKDIDLVVQYTPDHPYVLVVQGMYYEKQAYVEDAIGYYEKAYPLLAEETEADRQSKASLGNTLGYMYYIMALEDESDDMARKALSVAQKSISLNPDEPWCYMIRGLAYKFLEDYPKAIEEYVQALNLYHEDDLTSKAGAHGRIAEAQELQGNYNEAIVSYAKAFELNPNHEYFKEKKEELTAKVNK